MESLICVVLAIAIWISFFKQFHPTIAEYFSKIRRNITGFGPKETKVWAMLQEEDFDMMPYLLDYLENMNAYLAPLNVPIDEKQRENLKKKLKALSGHFLEIKHSNLTGTAFKDMLLEKLTADVLAYYPEIFNSNPKYIKDLSGVLKRHILKFGEDIDELAYKARNASGE
jgi:hypothetical protein